jgi:hypothetical protein
MKHSELLKNTGTYFSTLVWDVSVDKFVVSGENDRLPFVCELVSE